MGDGGAIDLDAAERADLGETLEPAGVTGPERGELGFVRADRASDGELVLNQHRRGKNADREREEEGEAASLEPVRGRVAPADREPAGDHSGG